jgi:hypothetical protein
MFLILLLSAELTAIPECGHNLPIAVSPVQNCRLLSTSRRSVVH